jgi:N-acetylmuramoyl-L-alanine amidase
LCIAWLLAPLGAPALDFDGTTYVSLAEVAGRLGMQAQWVDKGRVQHLKSEWTRMEFEVHKREFRLNGTRVHLGFPVVESAGRLHLSESDYMHQLQPILTPQLSGSAPALTHIAIDAGHGGKDPGAENPPIGLREKSLTLDLAKRLARELQAHGFRVTLTRETDTFLALKERSKLANQAGADLFISLHFNGLGNKSVHGIETYAFTPPHQPSSSRADLHSSDHESYAAFGDGAWSTLLGYYVQRSLVAGLGGEDRGLKRARFTVLEDLEMPGILVEGGFLTNDREGRNVGSGGYRDRLARAVVDGVLAYQRTLKRLSPEGS